MPTVSKAAAPTDGTVSCKKTSVPCDPAVLATPSEVWMMCAFTSAIQNTSNCLGDTVNCMTKLCGARYSHVELLFRFSDGWQVLKTNMDRGTVLIDADVGHYADRSVWKCFRFQLTEEKRRIFYQAAAAFRNTGFNMAALGVYTPCLLRVLSWFCCLFFCCGASLREDSGRYYCSQIVLLAMKRVDAAHYEQMSSSILTPDVLLGTLLHNGHIISYEFNPPVSVKVVPV